MGIVEKQAVLVPLKAKSDQYSFFLIGKGGDAPVYLPGVYLQLVEWPRTLVISELMGAAMALSAFPDGSTLELVRIPGNRMPGNYDAGTPLMRFRACTVLRKFVRNVEILELGLLIDCTVMIL